MARYSCSSAIRARSRCSTCSAMEGEAKAAGCQGGLGWAQPVGRAGREMGGHGRWVCKRMHGRRLCSMQASTANSFGRDWAPRHPNPTMPFASALSCMPACGKGCGHPPRCPLPAPQTAPAAGAAPARAGCPEARAHTRSAACLSPAPHQGSSSGTWRVSLPQQHR